MSNPNDDDPRRSFARALHRLGAIQFGAFTLKDGSTSPVYCDLRLLISDPAALAAAGALYAGLLAGLTFDRLAAIPYAGLPLGTAAALASGRPLIFPRKETKGYGTARAIEGRYHRGETVVVIDDLVTSGQSKLEAIAPLLSADLRVRDIVVLLDRRPAAQRDLEQAGYRVHAALTLHDVARWLHQEGKVTAGQLAAVERLLYC